MSARVYLVKDVSADETVSEDMQNAYLLCEQYISNGISLSWISPEKALSMTKITTQDVFVLQHFKGPVFRKLATTKGHVIGPRCLLCCMTEGSVIPPTPGPVYTVAMRDLVVTVSYLDPPVKEKLSKSIQWMGGKCENVMTEETTHLISGTVLSEKYIAATKRGLPIMKAEWVDAVWEASLVNNISATNPEFDSYKLSVFHNLVLSTSGLPRPQLKELTTLVSENGGKMLKTFESEVVNILITNINSTASEKFQAAQKYSIPCITSNWIYDSIKKGHSVDYKDYVINVNKTSSPNRESQLPDMSINLSVISNLRSQNNMETFLTQTSESTCSNLHSAKPIAKNSKNKNPKLIGITKKLAQLVDNIEMKDVKNAGLFLDGCCIFVYDLTATRKEKLHKVISRAGAVRYDQPTEAVTHAICGDPSSASPETYKTSMPRAVHVNVRWLIDSLHAKKTVDESDYLVFTNDKPDSGSKTNAMTTASPMSKRNLQLLRTPSKLPPVPIFNLDEPEKVEDEIVQQYKDHSKTATLDEVTMQNPERSKADNVTTDETSKKTVCGSDSSKNIGKKQNENMTDNYCETVAAPSVAEEKVEQIFEGLTFEIQDIDEEAEHITQKIVNSGGTLLQPGKGAAYIIVPLNYDEVNIVDESSQIVTTMWLDECLLKEAVIPVEYYHKPVKYSSDSKPFTGLVFAISTYTGSEREYIIEVAGLLGGIVQSSMHRRQTSNAFRSTHLICPEPSGAKYNGAINWGLPVVSSKWLLDCIAQNKRLAEEPYLVNEAMKDISKSNEVRRDISNTTNKENENKTSDDSETPDGSVSTKDFPIEEPIEIIDPVPTRKSNVSKPSTPLGLQKKINDKPSELTPTSRFLAMARQGLLDLESQGTPKRNSLAPPQIFPPKNDSITTPPMDNALSTPNLELFSPRSRRRLLAIKKGEIPSNPPVTPKNPFDLSIATPESPFGSTLQLSPKSRKRLWKFCEDLPTGPTEKPTENKETPLSEAMQKYFSVHADNSGVTANKPSVARSLNVEEAETPPAKIRKTDLQEASTSNVGNQLKQLNSILASLPSRNSRSKRSMSVSSPGNLTPAVSSCAVTMKDAFIVGPTESQNDAVGWDFMSESAFTEQNTEKKETPAPKVYRFMLSLNVDNSDEIKNIIERLGGTYLETTELDLSATHLICSKLVRSEKSLGCMASGRWILHPTYILRSHEAGRFVDEELYEWGNPKADNLCGGTANEKKFSASVHRWRKKITENGMLPFASFRVIMHIQESRKGPFLRLLLAGGGKVLDVRPPFSGEINATHCLMEAKWMALSQTDMAYLAKRRIPVCPPLLLNSILVEDPLPNAMDLAYPEYKNLLATDSTNSN